MKKDKNYKGGSEVKNVVVKDIDVSKNCTGKTESSVMLEEFLQVIF